MPCGPFEHAFVGGDPAGTTALSMRLTVGRETRWAFGDLATAGLAGTVAEHGRAIYFERLANGVACFNSSSANAGMNALDA